MVLPSTVDRISSTDCPHFRILVLGKTGCGKSSLINRVFGVNLAQVSHDEPGEADIRHGFCPSDNDRFILHDSKGFESGDVANFNVVKEFIEEQSNLPLKDRLHAIWVCISTPVAGDRVIETGVKDMLGGIDRGKISIIVVFTKYDLLVTSLIVTAADEIYDEEDDDDEQIWLYGEKAADVAFKERCIGPLTRIVGSAVPFVHVSTAKRYNDSIKKLIEVTDKQVQQQVNASSHTTPLSLAWAVAQRGNPDVSIEASIDVGRQQYWKGLISTTDFEGKKLQECLNVIHTDIIAVWNIRDPQNLLAAEEFKSTMSRLVEDLVPPARTPGNNFVPVGTALIVTQTPFGIIAGSLWTGVLFAKWVYDVYQSAPDNIACIMGYIVDLTIVMHKLSDVDLEITKDTVKSAIEDFTDTDIIRVHDDIRKFRATLTSIKLLKKDDVLDQIIDLIHKFCNSPK